LIAVTELNSFSLALAELFMASPSKYQMQICEMNSWMPRDMGIESQGKIIFSSLPVRAPEEDLADKLSDEYGPRKRRGTREKSSCNFDVTDNGQDGGSASGLGNKTRKKHK
jgi:hypothetical protein